MARILLVDNDSEWLGIIHRSLPEYQVDLAQSYDDAMARIRNEVPYDLAIVDLNLIDSPDRNTGDLLGSDILRHLAARSPATQRIVLTGLPPSNVKRQILDRYRVDDVLIKGNISLPAIRSVVLAAVARKEAGAEAGDGEQGPDADAQ
jgi:ActR/RegA family two-component response regulator